MNKNNMRNLIVEEIKANKKEQYENHKEILHLWEGGKSGWLKRDSLRHRQEVLEHQLEVLYKILDKIN